MHDKLSAHRWRDSVAAGMALLGALAQTVAGAAGSGEFIGASEPGRASTNSPLVPLEEKGTFTLPPGFEIELLASESEGIGKFVTVDWDTHGRMWSMTALEYPLDGNENPEQAQKLYASKAKDKVLVWDRPFEHGPLPPPRVFADGLAIPLGILPYGNGVYVQHGPEIVFLEDSDGDGRADQRKVILSGFGVQDSHLFPHQFTRAPGGWIWMAQGAFNYGKVRTTKGKEQQFDRTRMARFRYDGSDFEITSQGPCNIWGLVINGEGETWIQEANDYGYPAMPFHFQANYPGCSDAEWKSYAPEFPGTAPNFEMGGTGLSGLTLSDATIWPEPYGNTLYVANPITRKIQALRIHREGPRYRLEKLPDFIQSSDPMFRPVSVHFGPDGCLYVVDWYNKIISHNEVPRNHPERDKTRGRIWRVRHQQQHRIEMQDFTKVSGTDLLAKLGGESLTQSHLAWQAITDRQLTELAPKLKEIIRGDSEPAARRIASLWALEGLGIGEAQEYLALLQPLAENPNRNLRREAIRVLAGAPLRASESGAQVLNVLTAHAGDPDPEVRAEIIRTAAHLLGGIEAAPPKAGSRDLTHRTVSLLLAMVRPSLDGPTAKSTHNGRMIKVGEAYEREFERYLVRYFIEQHPRSVAEFLDADQSQVAQLPVDTRVWACLGIGGRDGAMRLAVLTKTARHTLSDEELTLMGSFAGETPIAKELSDYLSNASTQKPGLNALLRVHTRLQSPEVAALIAPQAKALGQSGAAREDHELFLKLAAAFRLTGLESDVVRLTTAENQAPDRQVLGVRALSEMGAQQLELFQRLSISSTNEPVQREAVSALAGAKGDRAVPLLAEIWPVMSPNLRKVAIDRLARSEQNSRAFVVACKHGIINADQLDTYAFDKLKSIGGNDSAFEALRKTARSAGSGESETATLKAKLDRVRELSIRSGDAARGRVIFATNCMVCHTVRGEGRNFGPVLNGAGAMDPESLLRSVVTPGAAIESGYYRFRVETKDGESVDGLLLSQNESEIRLRPVTGEDLRIPRSTVKRAAFDRSSLMPEGLLEPMKEQEVADLFTFLRTLK
jgi:putative membrane-bound dehydrogenase-like protein